MFKTAWELLRETFREWQEDKASRLAAALAYYTLFSLAPLMVIAINVAGLVVDPAAVEGQVMAQISGLLGDEAAETIGEMLEIASETGTSLVASIVGVVVLIFGATGVFTQLEDSLNTIWDVQPEQQSGIINIIRARVLSLTVVLGTGFLLLVSLLASAVLSGLTAYLGDMFALPAVGVLLIFDFVLSVALITVLFALIYKLLPAAEIAWRDVWVGAFVTALLFVLGQYIIGVYIARGNIASAYGAVGSLVLILVWVFYSAQIFLFGAEFTQVYARRFGSKIGQGSVIPEALTPHSTE